MASWALMESRLQDPLLSGGQRPKNVRGCYGTNPGWNYYCQNGILR
jgi:hypothetical protein